MGLLKSSFMPDHRLGHLHFRIDGESSCLPYLMEEFRPLRVSGPGKPPDVYINFVHELPPLRDVAYFSPLTIAEDAFEARTADASYQVGPRADGALQVTVRLNHRGNNGRGRLWLRRARNWNYLTPDEEVAKNFMYEIFDYLSQVVNLRLGQSYIHASSFELEGKGVLLSAWSGIGKTTSLLKMVGESGAKFLSDDLGMIDEDGVLWRTPRRMQIYAYNVEGQPRLRSLLMAGRSPLDRFSWNWKRRRRGLSGVRRRVSAEELFGPASAARSTPLTHAYFIERTDKNEFSTLPISHEEFAFRSAATLLRELEPFPRFAAAAYASGRQTVLPPVERLLAQSREIIKRGISRVVPQLIEIPQKAGPDDLAGYLRSVLRINRPSREDQLVPKSPILATQSGVDSSAPTLVRANRR